MKTLLEIEITPSRTPSPVINVESNIRASLSPFDMPRSAKFLYGRVSKRLDIEFSYLTQDEPKETIRLNYDLYLEVGKFSKKLYAARVHNLQNEINDSGDMLPIIDSIVSALETVKSKFDIHRPTDRVPYLNYSMMEKFLSFEKDSLGVYPYLAF